MGGIEEPHNSSGEQVAIQSGEKHSVTTQDISVTADQDEALKVIYKPHGSDEWEAKEERKLVRKIDRRLYSLLAISFVLQYFDKTMISQAAIFGLRTDLKLTGYEYTLSSALLYVGFLAGAYPASLLAQKFPIERVAGALIFLWGACLILTVTCTNFGGLAAQRTFLGLLEGGISPVFMLVIGSWYTKAEQSLRMGVLWSVSGYAAFVAPYINYGWGSLPSRTLHSWQYMYLFAGSITMIWAVIFYIFVPADPIRAKGFSDREKYVAVARLRTNNSGVRNAFWKGAQVKEALLDLKFWIMFAILFFSSIANGCFSTMTPIIINNFGFDSLHSLLLTSPTGLTIGTAELLVSWIASKTTNLRTILMFICQVPVLVAGLIMWILPRTHAGPLLFSVYFIPIYGGTVCLAFPLNLGNCAGYTKRTVYSAGAFVAYCLGNIAGPLSFRPADAPNYVPAFILLVVTTIITMSLVAAYRYVCIWENRKRDATGTLEAFDHAYEDDLTDKKNPQFRYIY